MNSLPPPTTGNPDVCKSYTQPSATPTSTRHSRALFEQTFQDGPHIFVPCCALHSGILASCVVVVASLQPQFRRFAANCPSFSCYFLRKFDRFRRLLYHRLLRFLVFCCCRSIAPTSFICTLTCYAVQRRHIFLRIFVLLAKI